MQCVFVSNVIHHINYKKSTSFHFTVYQAKGKIKKANGGKRVLEEPCTVYCIIKFKYLQ